MRAGQGDLQERLGSFLPKSSRQASPAMAGPECFAEMVKM